MFRHVRAFNVASQRCIQRCGTGHDAEPVPQMHKERDCLRIANVPNTEGLHHAYIRTGQPWSLCSPAEREPGRRCGEPSPWRGYWECVWRGISFALPQVKPSAWAVTDCSPQGCLTGACFFYGLRRMRCRGAVGHPVKDRGSQGTSGQDYRQVILGTAMPSDP
jgi:hypothetical protein